MKPSLQVRLSQHLALTPQLQQSIRLLQLSTLELHQEVEQMLEINPFLEVDDGPDDETGLVDWRTGPVASEASGPGDNDAGGTGQAESEPLGLDGLEAGVTARDDWENGTEADDFDGIADTPSLRNATGSEDGETDWSERSGAGTTLADALRVQLRGMRLQPQDAWLVEALIDSLDDDGYLADSLEDIADRLLIEFGAGEGVMPDEALEPEPLTAREELLSRLRCALGWLQSLEPTGVGARSLSECLGLQLRESPADVVVRDLAQRICREHLELLARRDWRKLMAHTGSDEQALRAAQRLIQTLEPKPGRAFAPAEANIIVPDVIVQKSGRGWRVMLNPDVMPKLRINDLYAQVMRQQRGRSSTDEASGGSLSGRLQEARWFVKNILQRFETIQRVSQAIVEHQKGFLSHGEIGMKPLVLREIADELGLHESTISRVTTAKYMATPFGTFELKYFFGSSLNTEAGGNASSTAVRALIRQFVAAEDARKPLSDSQLSTMLEEQGIQVARRTVAKYREALKIAPASIRKAL
jgi:RNA polymerase sigma-54 factor